MRLTMVDLQANGDINSRRKGSDGKVKILMDRTPSFLKSKFLSVLGSSNDLINGITTKVWRLRSGFCCFDRSEKLMRPNKN